MVQWLRLRDWGAGGAGRITAQASRFHMLKLRVHIPNLKTWHSQVSKYISFKKGKQGASLVVLWTRVHLPMQGRWVQALVQEISQAEGQLSPCNRTAEPACRNCGGPCAWSLCSAAREAAAMRGPCTATRGPCTATRGPCTATKSSPHSPQLEKVFEDPARPKIKISK